MQCPWPLWFLWPFLPLSAEFPELGLMLGLCISFHQLRDVCSLIKIWLVTNLITGDNKFKLHIHYWWESYSGLPLYIHSSFPCSRVLPVTENHPFYSFLSRTLPSAHSPTGSLEFSSRFSLFYTGGLLFPFSVRSMCSLLGPPHYLACDSVNCCVVIFFFTTDIPLWIKMEQDIQT